MKSKFKTQKMKMKFSFLCFVAITALTLFSCNKSKDDVKLFPIKSGDKWGYVDKTGKYIINPQFDDAFNFSEGLALFKSNNGKYGFIGEDGKYVINPIYKDATSFSEGLACVVMENGKPQFISKENKILFTVDKAEICFGFSEGMARVKIKGKWGYIDKSGKVIINPIYDDAKEFKDGLAAVAKIDEKKKEKQWGFIDKSGAVKINFQFVEDKGKFWCKPDNFKEGLAFVSSDGKQWGYIDKEGKYQINPQFEGCFGMPYGFKNGVSVVSQGNSFGYIDKTGKYIINPQYKDAKDFSANGLAAVKHSDDKWGFINKEGKYEVNPQFEEIARGFYGDVAFVKSFDKYGIIDKKGLYITNPQFDDVRLHDIGRIFGVKSDYVDNAGATNVSSGGGTFTDPRDGKVYQTVTIGNQEWMAENLAYEPSSGNYWAYDNNNSNVETYGYLYDWETACDVCPDGWHLPTNAEWTELTKNAGGKLKATGTIEAGTGLWYDPNTGATNETGFTALPGGYLIGYGTFSSIGYDGGWWSAAGHNTYGAWYRSVGYYGSDVYRYSSNKALGCSVRCLRD